MNATTPTRSRVRYWLYRKQNELAGGAGALGAPEGLFQGFEADPAFKLAGGYFTFAETWDVAEDGQTIVPREQGVAAEWDAHLEEAAKTAPLF